MLLDRPTVIIVGQSHVQVINTSGYTRKRKKPFLLPRLDMES